MDFYTNKMETKCEQCDRKPDDFVKCELCNTNYKNRYYGRHIKTEKHVKLVKEHDYTDVPPCAKCLEKKPRNVTSTETVDCTHCQITIKVKSLLAHNETDRHKKNAGLITEDSLLPDNKCSVCEFESDDPALYKKHYFGVGHKSKADPSKTYCKECDRHFASLNLHMRSKKHSGPPAGFPMAGEALSSPPIVGFQTTQ